MLATLFSEAGSASGKGENVRSRYLPLNIPGDLYRRLEERAVANERDPVQEVRWIIKQALATSAPQPQPRDLVTAGVGEPERAA